MNYLIDAYIDGEWVPTHICNHSLGYGRVLRIAVDFAKLQGFPVRVRDTHRVRWSFTPNQEAN